MEYNEHNLAEPPAKKVKLNSPGPNCGDESWLANLIFNDELPDDLLNGFPDSAPNQLSQLLSPSASVAVLSSPGPPRLASASLPQSPAASGGANSVEGSTANLGGVAASLSGMVSSISMSVSRPGGMMSPASSRFPSVSQTRTVVQGGGTPNVNMVGSAGSGSILLGGSPARAAAAGSAATATFPGNSIIINVNQQLNVSQVNSLQINSSQISSSQMNTVFLNSAQLKGLQLQKNGPYNHLQFSSSQQHLGSAMPGAGGAMQLNAIQGHGVQPIGVQLTNAQMGVASRVTNRRAVPRRMPPLWLVIRRLAA